MTKTLHGTIRGKTIELADDPGLGDGAAVEVVLRPAEPASRPGDGLRRLAGSLAHIPGLDDDMEEILRQRKLPSSRDRLE